MSKKCLALVLALSLIGTLFSGIMVYAATDAVYSDSFVIANQPSAQAYTSNLFNGIMTSYSANYLATVSVVEDTGSNAVFKFTRNSANTNSQTAYLKSIPFDLSGGKELIFREKFKASSGNAIYKLAMLSTSNAAWNANKEGFLSLSIGGEKIYAGDDAAAAGYFADFRGTSINTWFTYEARLKIDSNGYYTVDNYVFKSDGTLFFHPTEYASTTALTSAEIADLQIRTGVYRGYNPGPFELCIDDCSVATYTPSSQTPAVTTDLADLTAVPKNTTAFSLEYDQAVALAQGGSVTLYETNNTSNTVAVSATPKSFNKFNLAITGSLKANTGYTLDISNIKNEGGKAAANITFTTAAPVYTPNVTLSDSFDANYTASSLPNTTTGTYSTVGENGLFDRLTYTGNGDITIEPDASHDTTAAMKLKPTRPNGDGFHPVRVETKCFDASPGKEVIFEENFLVNKGEGTQNARGVFARIMDGSSTAANYYTTNTVNDIADMLSFQMYSLDADSNTQGSPIYGKSIAYNGNTWYKYIGKFKAESDGSYTVDNYITSLDGEVVYSAATKSGQLTADKLAKLENARIYTGYFSPYTTPDSYIMLDNCSLTTYTPSNQTPAVTTNLENLDAVPDITKNISLKFDQAVALVNGGGIELYETEAPENTVEIRATAMSFDRFDVIIDGELSVGKSYTLDVSDIQNSDGRFAEPIILSIIALPEFSVKRCPIVSGDISNGSIISATASIRNTTDEDETVRIILALYNIDETLVDVSLKTVLVSEGTLNRDIDTELTCKNLEQDGQYYAKAFVWADMLPLCKSTTYSDNFKIVLMGDSICQKYNTGYFPQEGWGAYVSDKFNNNFVTEVRNKAYGGYTTQTYIDGDGWGSESSWSIIKESLNPGDYIMLSLGINDNGKNVTKESYKENLKIIGREAKEKGADVIFITPTIHAVNSGNFYRTWGTYADAMITAAEELGCTVLDLSTEMCNRLNNRIEAGEDIEKIKGEIFMYNLVENEIITEEQAINHPNSNISGIYQNPPVGTGNDNTHLQQNGAEYVADIILDMLKISNSPLGSFVTVK